MNIELGKAIKIMRQAKGLSVSDFALKCKISTSYLSLIENGDRDPSISVIKKIAAALSVPVAILISIGMDGSLAKDGSDLESTLSRMIETEERLADLLKDPKNAAK